MFKNFAMDEKCRVYVSLKDIIYSRELTDLISLIKYMCSTVYSADDRKKAYCVLKLICDIDPVLQMSAPKDCDDVLKYIGSQIADKCMDDGRIELVYIDNIFEDVTMQPFNIGEPLLLLMSEFLLGSTATKSPSIMYLYDDTDLRYMPELKNLIGNKLISIDDFIKSYDDNVKGSSNPVDIIIGKTYISKYHDIIQPDKHIKVIMPKLDAILMTSKYQYTPTVIYENAII